MCNKEIEMITNLYLSRRDVFIIYIDHKKREEKFFTFKINGKHEYKINVKYKVNIVFLTCTYKIAKYCKKFWRNH